MNKNFWIILGVIFIVSYAWQFLPKSPQQILEDQQRKMIETDIHYEIQDIKDTTDRIVDDAHQIEIAKHPEGYSN